MSRKYIPSIEHLKAVEQMASKGVSQSKMAKAIVELEPIESCDSSENS